MSAVTNQSKIGFEKDATLCAFVDTGALGSTLEPSATATATSGLVSSGTVTSPAALKLDKAGTAYRVDLKNLEPGHSAAVALIGRLASFTGPSTGTLAAKVLDVVPSVSDARVAPGGRDAHVAVGDRTDEGSVVLALDSDRELWTRGQPVTIRMRVSNARTDATVGSVVSQLRYDPGLTPVDVKVDNTVGVPTSCGSDGSVFTCRTDYLAPGEEVTVTLNATVAQDAVTQFTARGATCPPRATDICVRASVTEVAGETRDWASAALAGNVAADTDVGITKLPAGVADHVRSGQLTRFVYLVSANPGLSLKNVRLTDPACPQPMFVSGDKNLNGLLDGGETWQYECMAVAPKNADVEISVQGASVKDGAIVTASGQLAVPVYDPTLEVQVPKVGQPMIQLANTGNVTLRGVAVVGRGCEAPPDVVIPPGGRLPVSCRSATGALRAFAVDPAGDPVTGLAPPG